MNARAIGLHILYQVAFDQLVAHHTKFQRTRRARMSKPVVAVVDWSSFWSFLMIKKLPCEPMRTRTPLWVNELVSCAISRPNQQAVFNNNMIHSYSVGTGKLQESVELLHFVY